VVVVIAMCLDREWFQVIDKECDVANERGMGETLMRWDVYG